MIEKINNKNKINFQDFFVIFLLLCSAVFLVFRCPYALDDADIPFYLTIPYRIVKGDIFFANEWHYSQLSAAVLYPAVWLYVKIVGSTEGIILFFGYLYIVFQFFISSCVYLCFRKQGIISVILSLTVFFAVPMTFQTFNYHSMGLGFLILICLICVSDFKNKTLKFIIIGVLVSLTALCTPMFVLIFILWTVIVFLNLIFKKSKEELFLFSSWIKIVLTVLFCASVFVAFMLSRASIKDIFNGLSGMMMETEYRFSSATGEKQNIINIGETLTTLMNKSLVLNTLIMLVFTAIVFDKKKKKHREIYLIVQSVICIIYLIIICKSRDRYEYGFFTYPLTVIGLTSYILTENKNKKYFNFLFLPGVLYSFVIDIESDGGVTLAVFGLAVSNIGSLLFLNQLIREIKEDSRDTDKKRNIVRLISVIFAFVIMFNIGTEIFILSDFKSTCYAYDLPDKNGEYEKMDQKMENGPQKGLIFTKTRYNHLKKEMKDLDYIKENCNGSVMITECYSWYYLYLEKPCGTHSSWIVSLTWMLTDETIRLKRYYELNPEKIPEYIYVPKADIDYCNDEVMTQIIRTKLDKIFDFDTKETDCGYILKVNNYNA